MTTSSSIVEPGVAQDLLDSFRGDINVLKSTLLASKLKGYSAIGLIVFLLGLAAAVSLDAFKSGWFPEWPGFFESGILTIPDYWV